MEPTLQLKLKDARNKVLEVFLETKSEKVAGLINEALSKLETAQCVLEVTEEVTA